MNRMSPDKIIAESFSIIEAEAGDHGFSDREWPVVRRMIHASGDMDLLGLVQFKGDAVSKGLQAISQGLPIVCDVTMVRAGLNRNTLAQLGLTAQCFIEDPTIAREAKGMGSTRSTAAMEHAIRTFGRAVYVVGNAPTALSALCEAVRQERVQPALIVAMPVGFVSVVESKQAAMELDAPVITVLGRKGGSAIAAACMNAMLLTCASETGP